MEIVNRRERFDIDSKRFRFPTTATSTCECGVVVKKDFTQDYLGHPPVHRSFNICFYCEECGREWEEAAILTVTLEAANGAPS